MITTNDGDLAAKLRVLRDHGQQPRYYHHYVGINSRLDALQAAVLAVKLPHLDEWSQQRDRTCVALRRRVRQAWFGPRARRPDRRQELPHVWNQYTVRVPGGRRDVLQKYLAERQIGSAIYYPVPLHLQKCFAPLDYREGSLPKTEQACREVLSLPVYPELTGAEQGTVIDAIESFCQAERQSTSKAA